MAAFILASMGKKWENLNSPVSSLTRREWSILDFRNARHSDFVLRHTTTMITIMMNPTNGARINRKDTREYKCKKIPNYKKSISYHDHKVANRFGFFLWLLDWYYDSVVKYIWSKWVVFLRHIACCLDTIFFKETRDVPRF